MPLIAHTPLIRSGGRSAAAAQSVINTVAGAGIKAILNFSPGAIRVPEGVKLKSMDLTVSLESLSFFLAQGEDKR